jgi:hypothetical protein
MSSNVIIFIVNLHSPPTGTPPAASHRLVSVGHTCSLAIFRHNWRTLA